MMIYLFTHENGFHYFYDTMKKLVHTKKEHYIKHNVYCLETGEYHSSSRIKLYPPISSLIIVGENTTKENGIKYYTQNFIEKMIFDNI